MPKKLQNYLFKIKRPRTQIRLSSPKNWLLSGCKHPRTPSFAFYANNNNNNNNNVNNISNNKVKDDAATLADVDRFLFENFKSLYLKDDEDSQNTKPVSVSVSQADPTLGSLLMDSPRLVETPRHLRGSNRFFVKTGFSGSLVEDSATNTSEEEEEEEGSMSTISNDYASSSMNSCHDANNKKDHTLPDNTIALLTYSSSPYEDFKRSMQEMVEARAKDNVNVYVDWDFMEELLFCYLNLNDRRSHKFILRAFVDLVTAMRRRNSEPAPGKPRSVRTVRSSRELRNNIY